MKFLRRGPSVAGVADPGHRLEWARLLVLALAGTWLLHPFATGRLYGAGDALWYADVLADFVLQLRHGIFPIFVGQTEFAFNGAVYPLRVAPLYQHLAGLLDLLTLHRLSFFWLQHLCVVVCGAAGIFASYFTLCALAPSRRWSACALAILYLSCPGVLGTIYVQDLYMTWMTVPLLPLAVYGMVRTFRRDDLRSQLWLAASLGALWMAHSPVALWTCFVAAITQACRLLFVHRGKRPIGRAAVGLLIFAVLAQYPFVSVVSLHTPGAAPTVAAGLPHSEDIAKGIHSVFPATLLPLSPGAEKLSDLQLGYGLWLALFAACAMLVRKPSWLLASLVGSAALLLLLLTPLRPVDAFWSHLPETVKSITYYWPMQRFYPIAAALIPAAAQLALGRDGRPARPSISGALVVLALAWSVWESRQFIRAGHDRLATPEFTALAQRPENLLLMNHSYGLFPALPPYFSNGVMDPQAETRVIPNQEENAPAPPLAISGQLLGRLDANPGVLDLSPPLRLEPGKRYDLVFRFHHPDEAGVLQIVGLSFFRQYQLPRSGQSRAFGSAAGNSCSIPLWTTDRRGDEISLRFVPSAGPPLRLADFADYELRTRDFRSEPVDVTSLMPFRATVRSDAPGWLETPRMAQPGYAATVDGRFAPVRASSAGEAEIAVPAGRHEIELDFLPSRLLRLSYWLALAGSAAAWAALAVPRARN